MAKFIKDISHHTFHNLIFVSAVLFSVWALFLLRFNRQAQFWVVVVFTLFYLSWAVIHHIRRGDLTLKLLVDYLLYAALAVAIGFIILFGRV